MEHRLHMGRFRENGDDSFLFVRTFIMNSLLKSQHRAKQKCIGNIRISEDWLCRKIEIS